MVAILAGMSLRRPWLVLFALSVAIAAGPSCAAPVVPLPPPTALVESPPDMDGFVTISGMARPGAFVLCLNEATEEGVIVRADPVSGQYSLRILAMSGDTLVLWQNDGGDEGGMQVTVIVPDP